MTKPRRRLSAVLTTAAVALSLAAVVVATRGAGAGPLTEVGYAVNKPLCTQPADPDAIRCYAMARVNVARGTRGAYRYDVRTNSAFAGPSGGYTPAALAAAYGFNPASPRSGFTVAVVDWFDDPHVLGDLNTFDRHYGLPAETARSFRKVNQHGQPSPLPQADRGSASEIALDVQAVRAVCHTCRIVLVEADAPTDADLAAAENTAVRLGASAVSNSFGGPERSIGSATYAAFNHPGVVITASTGDDGWYGWDYANSLGDRSDSQPSFPASSPYVVAVGGTSLFLNRDGTRASEKVWDTNGPSDASGRARATPLGASGGGCSTVFNAPAWQAHRPHYAWANCHGKRLAADMALDADPQTGFDIYDSYGVGGWVTIGGTSLSAPLAAAMFVLAYGADGQLYPAAALYVNGKYHPGTRYDVTVGGNSYCGGADTTVCGDAVASSGVLAPHNPNNLHKGLLDCSFPRDGSGATSPPKSIECNAAGSYDGPSGVGTPNSPRLMRATAPRVSVAYTTPLAGHAITFTAHVTKRDPAVPIRALRWYWGGSSYTDATSYTVQHTFRYRGTYHVRVAVTDVAWETSLGYATVTVR